MFSRIGIAKARRRTSKAATLDSEVAASQRMLDPFHPSVRLPRRVRTLYKNEYPAHLDEKEQLQWQEQQLVGVSTTNFLPKESPFGDVFLAAVTVAPIFAAIIMTAVVCFGDSHFITTSTAGYLLRLDSAPDVEADSQESLWLSLSGFCLQKGAGKMICRASPFATVYTAAYDGATVGSLRPFLPVNYASQAGLLLAALIAFIACAIFQTWASFDIRTAEMLESRRKREWVAEWMQARRLECLACASALAGVVCGVAAMQTLDSSTSVVASTVNLLGPNLTDTAFGKATRGTALTILLVAMILVGFSTVLQLLILAYDGLARRLRLEYESMIQDLDSFARDDHICVQRKLNEMAKMSTEMDHAVPQLREQVRQALMLYIANEDVASTLRRQELLLAAQRNEYETILAKSRIPTAVSLAGPTMTVPMGLQV